MNTRRRFLLILPALIAGVVCVPVYGDDEPLQDQKLQKFYREVRSLVRGKYRDSTSHLLKNKIHFEQDTRLFLIHFPLPNGEWLDPREERGPELGGISCDIEWHSGAYGGMAAGGQTFDYRYYQVLFLTPYSEQHDAHLIVHLAYPKNVDPEFLKEFKELVYDFAAHVD